MNTETHSPLADRRGVSLVEILVALTILSGTLLSLASAAGLASRQLLSGRTDLNAWAGSATVHGYPMTWTVSGTNPKKVLLEMDWTNGRGLVVTDTVVLYRAEPDTTS